MNIFDFTWVVAIISITGTFFNIKKKVFCFYLWSICEAICFILDIQNYQYGRAFLDIFSFGMNIYGIILWTKENRIESNDIERKVKNG
ncbi:MAG: nicotinamide mononucleotide transporter family protein [Oscillospiraceae bacterium]|jgi:nicotinamide riboside transporter PnuC|nr:nicotinamide mononucleotide transporter family protein [Oscillospiraceae bacterium]